MIKKVLFVILLFVIIPAGFSQEISVIMESPKVIITDIPVSISFKLSDKYKSIIEKDTSVSVQGIETFTDSRIERLTSLSFKRGVAVISSVIFSKSGTAEIKIPQMSWHTELNVIPGWLSLLPPLVAILLALVARQVLVALFIGVWIGAALMNNYDPFAGLFYGLTEYIVLAPSHPDNMSIVIFTLTLGGLVGVISKMGGTQGIVDKLSRYASNSRRGQFVTWLMGIFIFFDDYTNTLIVGNTMRPMTDKLKISREKVAYLVDSTAAPVANIAVISTWIGFEIGLIGTSFNSLGIADNAYLTFLQTIPYNFYPVFALVIGLSIAWFGRDIGPMLKAERRAAKTGQVLAPGATPLSSLDTKEIVANNDTEKRWYNGFVPIFVVILTTLLGLWFTGLNSLRADGTDLDSVGFIHYISLVIGASDSYSVLMLASFIGSLTAIIMAISQKILKLNESILAWIGGVKAMLLAVLILTLAWSIGNICTDLKTADYIIHISEGLLSPYFIPLLSFIIASLISFATGTSFGVMAIMLPIVIPIAHLVPQADPAITVAQQQGIFLSTIASVLAGSTFGDHCSPISDTTIMSSMASGADHIDHVRTQLPYAIFGGVLSMVVGYIPIGFGVSPFLMLPLGILIIVFTIRFLAPKVQEG